LDKVIRAIAVAAQRHGERPQAADLGHEEIS
jgi:hypothetical protein